MDRLDIEVQKLNAETIISITYRDWLKRFYY